MLKTIHIIHSVHRFSQLKQRLDNPPVLPDWERKSNHFFDGVIVVSGGCEPGASRSGAVAGAGKVEKQRTVCRLTFYPFITKWFGGITWC